MEEILIKKNKKLKRVIKAFCRNCGFRLPKAIWIKVSFLLGSSLNLYN